MSFRVLRAGIDTLEVTFTGEVFEEIAVELDRKKAAAAVRPQPHYCGPVEMMVEERAFGRWSWRLASPEFSIVVQRGKGRGVKAQVRFSAFGLVNRDLRELWALAKIALRSVGDFKPLTVSRVDVCVDFQGWRLTPLDLAGIVCAAPYRATHGTEAGVQTFQYGKGDAVMRVYDKTAELEESHKYWLKDVWGQSDVYDPEEDVWRAEIQLRRNVLKELHIDCVEQVIASPGAILDYGLTWANLRVPTGDSTKARWPEDPRWSELRRGVFGGVPLCRAPRPSQLMTLDATKTRMLGLVATAAAYFDEKDYMKALQKLSYAVEAHMMREKIDFAALAEDKRRRVIAGEL